MATTKRVTKATISRQQKLKDEIYSILQKEAHNSFKFIESRENAVSKRLAAMEANGVPDGILEELKRDISALRYTMNKQTRAIENLLSFFNVSKELLNASDDNKVV